MSVAAVSIDGRASRRSRRGSAIDLVDASVAAEHDDAGERRRRARAASGGVDERLGRRLAAAGRPRPRRRRRTRVATRSAGRRSTGSTRASDEERGDEHADGDGETPLRAGRRRRGARRAAARRRGSPAAATAPMAAATSPAAPARRPPSRVAGGAATSAGASALSSAGGLTATTDVGTSSDTGSIVQMPRRVAIGRRVAGVDRARLGVRSGHRRPAGAAPGSALADLDRRR